MKITDIKFEGRKLNSQQLEHLAAVLHHKIEDAGFVTRAFVVNSSRIDINERHMRYASINIAKRAKDAQFNKKFDKVVLKSAA